MANVVTITDINGIRWQVNTDYASYFLASSPPDPRRILKRREGEIIKKSPVRVIFASSLVDGERELPVVIKIYRHAKVGDWIKANLLGSKAKTEWKITTAAVERGLMTIVPVAYGERRSGGILKECYLVSVRLFDCVTLEEALFSPDGRLRAGARERRRILAMLARLLREMHDKGIYHRDLHPGNFLLSDCLPGGKCLYLLDLHRASVCRTLPLRHRIKSLAQFNMLATLALSRSERLFFFKSYFSGEQPWRSRKRWLLETIDDTTRRGRWRLWKKRQKRCVNSNKYFIRLQFAGMKGFARRGEWRGEMGELLLADPRDTGEKTLVKDSRSKNLWEKKLRLNGVEKHLFVKHYKRKRGWKAVRYIFRRSPAIRSWRGAYMLAIRNLNTVRAIAALEERSSFHRLGNAYFIAEKIHETDNLISFIARRAGDIRPVINGVAHFLRTIHDRGIFHGDMKATNILVKSAEDGSLDYILTDLDHVSARYKLSRRQIRRNIFQLNKSFPDPATIGLRDRYRFLAAYCGPYREDEIRPLWEDVARLTRKHFKKYQVIGD